MYLCARVYCLCCAYDRPNLIAHTRTQQLLRTRHGGRGLAAVCRPLSPPPPRLVPRAAPLPFYILNAPRGVRTRHAHTQVGRPTPTVHTTYTRHLLESTHTNTHTQTNTQSTLYHAYVSHRQCVGLSLNANRARPYFISLLYPHINAFGAPPPGSFPFT
jgi:hypothetical protein